MKFKKEWLQLSDSAFETQIARWFGELKGFKYAASTRVEHVQTAIDEVWGYAQFKDGITAGHNAKWNAISRQHKAIFGSTAPVPSPTIAEKLKKVNIAAAKEALLVEKLACLKHWKDTIWTEGFLQGAEDEVQDTMNDMVADARRRVAVSIQEPWMETWLGFDASKEVEWTNERYRRAVSGEAKFRLGAEAKGEFELVWKSAKLKVKTENFIGVRGSASASAQASVKRAAPVCDAVKAGDLSKVVDVSASVAAEASLEVGLRMAVEAAVEIGDVFEATGKAEAFAGAMAKAEAKLELSGEGLSIGASAEAFAGVKLETEGSVTLKWKGRPIWTQSASAALTFGVGAKAEFALTVQRGAVELELGANVTLGLGTEVGTKVVFSITNLQLSAEQWLYEEVRQFLVPRERRYELMMGDKANMKACDQCTAELTGLLAVIRSQKAQAEAMRFR